MYVLCVVHTGPENQKRNKTICDFPSRKKFKYERPHSRNPPCPKIYYPPPPLSADVFYEQPLSDCSFVQYFSMSCPFSAQPHMRSKPIVGDIIVELGISKLWSFEKRFVRNQALLRHNEYRKANYKKKLRYLQKKLWTHLGKRDCSLQCLNGRHFITSWNFIVKF